MLYTIHALFNACVTVIELAIVVLSLRGYQAIQRIRHCGSPSPAPAHAASSLLRNPQPALCTVIKPSVASPPTPPCAPSSGTGLAELPPELVLQIAQALDTRSILSLSAAARMFRGALGDAMLWRCKLASDFGWREPLPRTGTAGYKEQYMAMYARCRLAGRARARDAVWDAISSEAAHGLDDIGQWVACVGLLPLQVLGVVTVPIRVAAGGYVDALSLVGEEIDTSVVAQLHHLIHAFIRVCQIRRGCWAERGVLHLCLLVFCLLHVSLGIAFWLQRVLASLVTSLPTSSYLFTLPLLIYIEYRLCTLPYILCCLSHSHSDPSSVVVTAYWIILQLIATYCTFHNPRHLFRRSSYGTSIISVWSQCLWP
ncbi:hypothetical protein SeMB42_g00972 [Synchytrium endobioticum]|uniref:F-box domain-containing protein n=1 Tax=Synchytrium endobioticum TaxID=286115 RepID=A0A507DNN4_9FUNG|nr:hypothetical protein SeMB42_g00972 [Synchytrium endobioticum]